MEGGRYHRRGNKQARRLGGTQDKYDGEATGRIEKPDTAKASGKGKQDGAEQAPGEQEE
jgi:hypothetical protein